MHYLLFYDVIPAYAERREAHREAHLAHARAAALRGELVLGGALADPVDGAVLLFRAESARVCEAFAEADPYVVHGLVTGFEVRPWTTVVGATAERPIAPAPTDRATKAGLLALLRSEKHWVLSSVGPGGAPSSAVIGVAVTDDVELVFDTLETTRKASNIARDARVSLVMWSGAVTAQIEGDATRVPTEDPAAASYLDSYLKAFPDGRERLGWAGIAHYRVRPRWIRVSDFSGDAPVVVEVAPASLEAAPHPLP